MRKTNFPNHHFRLATRGRSIQLGQQETHALQQKARLIAFGHSKIGPS
jgi:hypothetical protein